jgi:hypothetical protein
MSQNHVGTKLINKMFISIQELEAAINFWREQSPSRGEALQLCPQAAALAKPYAMMIIQSSQRVPLDGLSDLAQAAWKEYLSRKG